MFAGVCRIVAALAKVCLSFAAVAQVIPPSEKPGREVDRFSQPPAPRAEPGGTAITLPSTVAPRSAFRWSRGMSTMSNGPPGSGAI